MEPERAIMCYGKKKLKTGVFIFGIAIVLTLNIDLISAPSTAENKSGTVDGIDLDYDLQFAPTLVSDDAGQSLAHVYSFDYTVRSNANRPVTFITMLRICSFLTNASQGRRTCSWMVDSQIALMALLGALKWLMEGPKYTHLVTHFEAI